MVVHCTRFTLLPAGMKLVAIAIAACLLMIEPAVAEPARVGVPCSKPSAARAERAAKRISSGSSGLFLGARYNACNLGGEAV
jgi:hypothetical protein